jgi:radical SAM protein with 4Fe4S-binding SPASM domain
MIERSYSDFSLALRRNAVGAKTPLNGSIEVTHRCSLACAHCYNNRAMSDRTARATELSCDELIRIVGEIADAGGLYLLFTGGEIFARRDFLEVYRHAKQLGFIVTLFTNATLITDRVADELARLPPFVIEITLYGHTPETYERLTGVRGAFGRVRQGIRRLVDRGLPVRLKTVGTTHTLAEMAEMNRFALAEVGQPLKFDSLINGRIDGDPRPLATRLPPERIVALDLADERRVTGWREFAQRSAVPMAEGDALPTRYHCGGGITSYAIDPEGRLSICVLSKRESFDLRRGSFAEGWSSFLRGVRAQSATRRTKCSACGIKAMCGMCPAMGELETGDPDEPVPFLCEVAHLRAAVLDIPILPHGACEFCPGGARHEEMRAATARVRLGEAAPGRRSLPMLTDEAAASCGAGGCGSCASGEAVAHG